MDTENQPSAFPRHIETAWNNEMTSGMTLRDYFASSAMQGLMSMEDKGTSGSLKEMADKVASFSYEVADAMLKQREL